MNVALQALLPVFGVIALGFIAKHNKIVPETAWGAVNSFGYWLLYPAFLFSTVAHANFAGAQTLKFLGCLILGFAMAATWALAMRFVVKGDGPAFTSVFQGSVRWNGFVILAAAPSLFGPEGTTLVALGFGPVVAFVNVVSVFVLARWGDHDVKPSLPAALAQVSRNPLILASIAGVIANVSGIMGFLGPLAEAVALLGRAAMPIALMSVGAALSFSHITKAPKHLVLAVASKLLIAPLLMLGAGQLLGLPPLLLAVAIGFASMPSAPASYVLAREMGGDAPLMAGIVTVTTILALITIPFWHSLIYSG